MQFAKEKFRIALKEPPGWEAVPLPTLLERGQG